MRFAGVFGRLWDDRDFACQGCADRKVKNDFNEKAD